ncbi:hypothetical protein AB1Y20_010435 [Prymnesium parvum]|uniref:Transcription factor CBF/NF-Y/archaeal histone domain-containing protein n=1 Tax=Prymnesium parvum TaxID=97485 RepID=A0AB34IPI9_PRYPA|mmetsp:Transcript_18266/g.45770  ORF Transcript_18266/g.45770 Transcript_18266/m.45770 type:complete len:101 (-) Transcript_18266:311-613(-)
MAELGLPRAAVCSLVDEHLPAGLRCSPEAKECVRSCLEEVLQMLTAQANDASMKEKKNTISERHVHQAVEELGLAERLPSLAAMCSAEVPPRKKKKISSS